VCIAGFIDFIVDPSFQVMGDMLEKITVQLQQQRSDDDDDDDDNGGGSLKINRATNTGSMDSLKSSDSMPGSLRLSDRGTAYTYRA